MANGRPPTRARSARQPVSPQTNRLPRPAAYSPAVFCRQLHALYNRLEKRRQEILQDPDLNPDNDELVHELDLIVKRIALIRECFEQFCPS
jgi:hypothetical protein